LEKGFVIARQGNVWHLKMAGSNTEAQFGTLSSCMRCAYWLADGLKDWQTDSNGGTA
jgi:hypothetical protein